ncbi:hypothetical protein B0H16DRAFT_1730090 [Mycena metata]|uniref:Uncharacterized protein n=1 Tax=Mycena metata TaxID=1033252 RepID=A0AAD7MYY5_9AGAR|nr:hypothetical protein B0H16DRAFT_1730090 [Mycena metata]
MPRPRGDKHELVPDSNEELDTDGSLSQRLDLIPEKHIHRGPDGHLHYDHNVVEAPASPSKPARRTPQINAEPLPHDSPADDNNVVYVSSPKSLDSNDHWTAHSESGSAKGSVHNTEYAAIRALPSETISSAAAQHPTFTRAVVPEYGNGPKDGSDILGAASVPSDVAGVQIAPYYQYLAENWKYKQERSTCVAHNAVDKPDHESRGTASSGIVTVDCARHNMKRPNAVGDLQLGERYINMDCIFMGLAGSEISELYVSYYIACQWHKNIGGRMQTFPSELRFVRGKQYCAPERGWSLLNPLASSTAEMGPGMRRDIINDAFNDMNHKKIVDMGTWMLGKVADCVPELIMAAAELEELERLLHRLGAGGVLREWRAEVRGEMADEVQKEMEDAMKMDSDGDDGASEELHATELIAMGLQLEELQRNLSFDINGIGNHRLRTRRRISPSEGINYVLRAEEDRARKRIAVTQPQPGVQVQHMSLWLPSSIRARVECDVELYEYEYRLHHVQAHESLDEVRHQLLLRTHLYKHKDAYVRGVKANTRVQARIAGVEVWWPPLDKITFCFCFSFS